DPAVGVVAEGEVGRSGGGGEGEAKQDNGGSEDARCPSPASAKEDMAQAPPHADPDSPSHLRRVNDHGAEVGDVGERRAGPEQVADAVEKPRRIVVREK